MPDCREAPRADRRDIALAVNLVQQPGAAIVLDEGLGLPVERHEPRVHGGLVAGAGLLRRVEDGVASKASGEGTAIAHILLA